MCGCLDICVGYFSVFSRVKLLPATWLRFFFSFFPMGGCQYCVHSCIHPISVFLPLDQPTNYYKVVLVSAPDISIADIVKGGRFLEGAS